MKSTTLLCENHTASDFYNCVWSWKLFPCIFQISTETWWLLLSPWISWCVLHAKVCTVSYCGDHAWFSKQTANKRSSYCKPKLKSDADVLQLIYRFYHKICFAAKKQNSQDFLCVAYLTRISINHVIVNTQSPLQQLLIIQFEWYRASRCYVHRHLEGLRFSHLGRYQTSSLTLEIADLDVKQNLCASCSGYIRCGHCNHVRWKGARVVLLALDFEICHFPITILTKQVAFPVSSG